ncbi:GNAT family N-acetyltransferase [Actinoplanes sp. NPDC051494]|uniref:GNAT family N-acetyltransferase n=1 Tax=Actinoplanes sp. NPDC051494 TaxID=3363907 RepID=UPI00378F40DE
MDASDIPIRVGGAGDWDAIWKLLAQLFHTTPSDENSAYEREVFEPGRALIAEDDGSIVGHAAAYTRELTVPGAIVPAAHVTLVGVAPTHRRRGILTRMMDRQLRDVAAAGNEPIAVLWASETRIYPRFGYGPAAQRLKMEISTTDVRLPATPAPRGRLRQVEPTEAIKDFTQVYEGLRATRVGWSSRGGLWWEHLLADPLEHRGGATPSYGVVHETADGPTGYAIWSTKSEWDNRGPNGQVLIREIVAADPEAYLTLWRFLLSLDLTRRASMSFAAVDEPLQYLVDEPRRLGITLADALWIRVVDLPAALTARRYSAPLDVVIDVTDPLIAENTGRWRLAVDDSGTATCTRSAAPADLACTILELGTAYLGAVSFAALAAAGTVHELTPGTLPRVTAAFRWHRMPQATEVF